METMGFMLLATVISSMMTQLSAHYQQKAEFDQQNELLKSEQEYNTEREDIAWQRSRPQQMFSDLLASGFNPNLAAQSVLGGASESATSSGSPAAPSVNSAIDALSRSFTSAGENVVDDIMKKAQIENIESNTNKTDVEAGLMPREYRLRMMSVDGQLKVWNKSVEKMSSEIGLTNEQKELVKQQHLYYGRLSDAQIEAYRSEVSKNLADASLAYQKIKESQKYTEVLDADVALKNAQTSNVIQDTSNKIIQGDLDFQTAERQRIAKEFEQKCGGIPLTADAQRYVNSLMNDGKVEEVRKFYESIFQSSLNQSIGNSVGEYGYLHDNGKPYGQLFQLNKGGLFRYANPYQFSPVFNPPQ